MVRTTKERYEAFEDTEEEASHIKIFLEEGALGNQPWLPSSHPGTPECGERHCFPGRFNF